MGHSRPLFIYFRLFNTVDNKQMLNKILPMTGVELQNSGIKSNRSTNWATTTSLQPSFISQYKRYLLVSSCTYLICCCSLVHHKRVKNLDTDKQSSVTRLAKNSPLWQYIISFGQFFGPFIYFIWKNCEPTLVNLLCFWAISIAVKGQNGKNNLPVRSHWSTLHSN